VRLAAGLAAGRNVVPPTVTHSRYVAHAQDTTPLTVTSPADNTSVEGSPVTVTGTTASGNTVYVAATSTDANSATTIVSTTAAADGSFSVDVPISGGTNVLNVVAVSPSGGTGHVRRTVLFDFVPGTLLLDVTDPDGDDNGPGNYAYPTFEGFHDGAFDIQRFQVYDSGPDVIFRLKARDLSETFGSPLGAQPVDVYVNVPGAPSTSTAAAHPLRNFTIAPAFAWSRLIQVQGFGQRYVDAGGNTLGTVSIAANAISRFITFGRPKGVARNARPGLEFHGRPHRPGRLQPRPGARLRPDAAAVPVRRLRDREHRSALHVRSQPRPEGGGREHRSRCRAVDRARLHPGAGRANRGRDAVVAAGAANARPPEGVHSPAS
jgi:glucoamylase